MSRIGTPRYAVAILVAGVSAGLGGIALTLLLHAVQHVCFGYTESTFLQGVERASPVRRVLALTVGGTVVGTAWWWQRRHDGLQVSVERTLAGEARLPVGPVVLDGTIQIVAVGVGASLGREGAPRQFGAAGGAYVSDRLGLSAGQRRTLVAAGAGAGLAAVYNVPFGGAAFALEILLGSFALVDVVPAVVVSWIATVVAWPALGRHATYAVPHVALTWSVLVASFALGPAAGAVATTFRVMARRAERTIPPGWWQVPAIVAAFTSVGALAIVYPEVLGNGKGASQVAFDGAVGLSTLAALVVLKPIATAVCLRAGARGGLLTPALATGAVLGAAGGHLWLREWAGAAPAACAIMGAAAVLASTQQAPFTAVVLVLELTHVQPAALPPMLIAVALSILTSRSLTRSPGEQGRARQALRRVRRSRAAA